MSRIDILREFDWEEKEKDLWETAYESDRGDLIYIEDSYKSKHPHNQTEIDDWNEERYNLRLRNALRKEVEDDIMHSSSDWNEVEAYLETAIGDFE